MRKITWTCQYCAKEIANSTFKITNGKDKGKTLKQKHLLNCGQRSENQTDSSENPVSSTEERVKEGEKIKKKIKEIGLKSARMLDSPKHTRVSL